MELWFGSWYLGRVGQRGLMRVVCFGIKFLKSPDTWGWTLDGHPMAILRSMCHIVLDRRIYAQAVSSRWTVCCLNVTVMFSEIFRLSSPMTGINCQVVQ